MADQHPTPARTAPTDRARPSMSIGQVLAALKPEFSDISVSKIRFLESEGLLTPERTPSGYRKFSTDDLEQLRLILRLQRDSFLPLKVIKERLDAGLTSIPLPADAPPAASQPTERAPAQPAATPAAVPTPPAPEPPRVSETISSSDALELSEVDLANAADLEIGQVKELREFGVICEHQRNGTTYFDSDDLRVSKAARGLMDRGIGARHLKTLRRIAQQEADMLGQVVAPALHNRRTEIRQQAMSTLDEISDFASELRSAFITQHLREQLSGDR